MAIVITATFLKMEDRFLPEDKSSPGFIFYIQLNIRVKQ